MSLILALRDALDPLFEHTTFAPLEVGPHVLEFGGALDDGRVVLFGFYHDPARRTVTAALWMVPAPTPDSCQTTPYSVVEHRRAWDYSSAADINALVHEVVAGVVAWLQPPSPTSGPESGTLPGD